MRLLDLITQGQAAQIVDERGSRLPSAGEFADRVRGCPLRYVLSNNLVVAATSLAFSEGDRLDSCLDLIHVPAQRLWVEWLSAPRHAIVQQFLGHPGPALTESGGSEHRAGTLVSADPCGRKGTLRAFWSMHRAGAIVSPVVAEFDLTRCPAVSQHLEDALEGGWVRLTDSKDDTLSAILSHFRFGFDPVWLEYYRSHSLSKRAQHAVVLGSLSGIAFDGPMLLAFFLLLSAKTMLPQHPSALTKLNLARKRAGRAPLLEHVEVHAPLEFSMNSQQRLQTPQAHRRGPRLHHVRGHLVRRGSRIYWRSPHLRGSAYWGHVRSRTVEFHIPEGAGPRFR
jgi:hypothetical protein